MKILLTALVVCMLHITTNAQTTMKTLYDFKVNAIDGKPFDMLSLKGKKVMVVNTASECGFTAQYEDLQKLYTLFMDKNFVVIGFPANNFGAQEPGTNVEIQSFCKKNYGVTFPMMEKISVKGDDINPLYSWLTNKDQNGKVDGSVKWNFQKYLIDENGNVVDVAYSVEKPGSDRIIKWIEAK
jgi:glutathione peroxidase